MLVALSRTTSAWPQKRKGAASAKLAVKGMPSHAPPTDGGSMPGSSTSVDSPKRDEEQQIQRQIGRQLAHVDQVKLMTKRVGCLNVMEQIALDSAQLQMGGRLFQKYWETLSSSTICDLRRLSLMSSK